jgi:hypothetical protein
MEIQEIDVFVQPDGKVRIEVRGVKGKKCLALTEDIEKLLGGRILNRELTPEHNEEAQITVEDTGKIKQGW